ncbi:hypothetical protein QEN19_002243 [Hanseniaspora menglaensis]
MSFKAIVNNENSQQEFGEKKNKGIINETPFELTPLKEIKQMSGDKGHPSLLLGLRESNQTVGVPNTSSSHINHKSITAKSPESQRLSFIQQQQINQQGSPINHSHLFNNSINNSHSMNISPQIERSMRLTSELESLVNDLDLIYNEIGLSSKEIQQKEADIFRNLSDTIRSFSSKAQQEKQMISKENAQVLDCLKTILHKIGDSKGSYTINDLYIRNMIVLSQHDLSPSKRDMSLLNKRRILMQGAEYVFDVFDKILTDYLKDCKEFIKLRSLMNDENDEKLKEYDTLGLLSSEECLKLEILLQDSSKLLKCFFDNIFNSGSFPHKILNHADLQSYNNASYNKLTQGEKKENQLKKMIAEMSVDYLNKKETLIIHLSDMSKCLNFLQLNITDALNIFYDESCMKYKEYLAKYTLNIPSLADDVPTYDGFLETVSNLLVSVKKYKMDRIHLNDELISQIRTLWSKLKISQLEIEEFESSLATDFTLDSSIFPLQQIESLKTELNRLKMLRKTSIKQIIEEDWFRINELWNIMRFPHTERQVFKDFYESKQLEIKGKEENRTNTDHLNDENEVLLNNCEDEIRKLEEKHKLFEPLLKNIDLYETFISEKLELEASSKDPGRLTSRDSHKILSREEKIRKRISRYFPSVVNNLATQLQEFNKNFHRSFLKETGEDYLTIILQEKDLLAVKYPRSRVVMSQQTIKPIGGITSEPVHRPPAANRGIRERNKRILNTAAKPLYGNLANNKKAHYSNLSSGAQTSGLSLRRRDNRIVVPKAELLTHSRISSRNSLTSSLNSRFSSRSISNRSEMSAKIESPNPELFDFNVRKVDSSNGLASQTKTSSPNRSFKKYERNGSILKRSLSPEKINPEDYSFKKVRISNNDQFINRSITNSISSLNESLSPIKPSNFLEKSAQRMENSFSKINVMSSKSNLKGHLVGMESMDNSLNDDVDVAEDMKFNLWQTQQLAKLGSNKEPQETIVDLSRKDVSEAGIGVNDTSNF